MREKEIEQKLVREVKRRGGICPKFVSPGANGMPDRIVFLRDGCMAFAEVKSPGKSREHCRQKGTATSESWGTRYL